MANNTKGLSEWQRASRTPQGKARSRIYQKNACWPLLPHKPHVHSKSYLNSLRAARLLSNTSPDVPYKMLPSVCVPTFFHVTETNSGHTAESAYLPLLSETNFLNRIRLLRQSAAGQSHYGCKNACPQWQESPRSNVATFPQGQPSTGFPPRFLRQFSHRQCCNKSCFDHW